MKTDRDMTNLLSLAEESARAAGASFKSGKVEILRSWGKDIKINADKNAHEIILGILQRSGIPVLSEEDDQYDFSFSTNLKWIVDPLDGSINFLRGIPASAVSIGLVKGGETILGVVYDFNRGEMFSGIVGKGAWLNGEDISVSNVREKGEAIIMTGFPSHTDFSTESLKKYISMAQAFKKIRLLGSAALSLAYVASGRADAYYEKDIKIWDVAAGLALVKSAGGNYTNTKIDKEGKCTVYASNMRILSDEI